MAHADWLVKLRIACAIYLRATREKMASGLHPCEVKKSSKLIVRRAHYLTVLAYTKQLYNVTKAKRALWLANSASTICPWVYAADVLSN